MDNSKKRFQSITDSHGVSPQPLTCLVKTDTRGIWYAMSLSKSTDTAKKVT